MQIQLMPELGDVISMLPPSEIHGEILCLPSDFTKARRDELRIAHLEDIEIRLREGEAQDALRDLRMTVRNINTLTFQKQVEVRGQDANTRSNEVINRFKTKRYLLVMKYNAARTAMIALGCTNIGDDDDFPALSEADATMKHSEKPYQLGDGKRLGGPLFTAGVGKRVVLPNEPGMNISWLICVHVLICDTGRRSRLLRTAKVNDKPKSSVYIYDMSASSLTCKQISQTILDHQVMK